MDDSFSSREHLFYPEGPLLESFIDFMAEDCFGTQDSNSKVNGRGFI